MTSLATHEDHIPVLMIEDDEDYSQLIQKSLYGFSENLLNVDTTKSLSGAIDLLAKKNYEVVLLDLNLKESQGLDTLRQLLEVKRDLPIVVLTGVRDEKIALEAVREGAQEYLLKDELDEAALVRSLKYSHARHQVIQKLQKEREKDYFLATHDPLTKLPNRLLFNELLEQALAEAERYQEKVGILFLDLDEFKSINDKFGHLVGDQVLRVVAAKLKHCIRQEDTAARFGGDEFAVFLRHLHDTSGINRVVSRIQDSLRQHFPIEGRQLVAHCSIGISLYPFSGQEPEELIHKADKAMYSAKNSGGNRYQYWNKYQGGDSMTHRKILIIDDDMDTLSHLKKWLEFSKYSCSCAPSIEEALNVFQETKPDLVLLDLGFTKANGTAFLQHAKEYLAPNQKMPPVIILSGNSDSDIRDLTFELGASDFIAKPYDLDHLMTKVTGYLQ